jgi:putative RNA 2'-phosphotransferase
MINSRLLIPYTIGGIFDMLRQCLEHGYFRGQMCPECNQKGRFLMNDNELNGLGRVLAGVLRHFPEKFKLEMDDHGWIVIYSLINAVRTRSNQYHWLRPHHLLALVETDPKGRYQIKDNLIRATYGHSLNLDLDLPKDNIPEKLYYPTTKEEVELLMETGIKPSDRKKVHLSLSFEDAEEAGKVRVPQPLILEIDAKSSIEAGFEIMHAGTTVFITNEVPPDYLQLLDSKGEIIEDVILMKKKNQNQEKPIDQTQEEDLTQSTPTGSNKDIESEAE